MCWSWNDDRVRELNVLKVPRGEIGLHARLRTASSRLRTSACASEHEGSDLVCKLRVPERARESAVKEFGLLRSEDLARATHSTAENVSLVASKWRRRGEIFAVNYGGKPGYFAFQFDPVTGRPKPVIAKLIEAFPANTDGWRLALWLISANPRLANRRPIDVLDKDPDKMFEAAKAENRVELF